MLFAGIDVSSLCVGKDDAGGDGGVLGRGILLFIITCAECGGDTALDSVLFEV